MIENRWVSSESQFLEAEKWDRCIDPDLSPVLADSKLHAWVGVDASVKRDSTAIVVCGYQSGKDAGLPMVEYADDPSLTAIASNLYELVKGRNLLVYPDAGIRKSVLQTVASEE